MPGVSGVSQATGRANLSTAESELHQMGTNADRSKTRIVTRWQTQGRDWCTPLFHVYTARRIAFSLLLCLYRKPANPRQQLVEVALVVSQQPDQEAVSLVSIHLQLVIVQAAGTRRSRRMRRACYRRRTGGSCERFEQRGRHLGEVGVVSGPGAVQGAFQEAVITHTRWASEAFQQGAVDGQHLVPAQKSDAATWQEACPVLRFRRWTAQGVSTLPAVCVSWRQTREWLP